jgi:hypothetical protein
MAVSLHYLILNSPNARLSYPISFLLERWRTYRWCLFRGSSHEGQRAPYCISCMIAWLVGMGCSGDAATHTVQYFRAHGEMVWRSGLINHVVKVSRSGAGQVHRRNQVERATDDVTKLCLAPFNLKHDFSATSVRP